MHQQQNLTERLVESSDNPTEGSEMGHRVSNQTGQGEISQNYPVSISVKQSNNNTSHNLLEAKSSKIYNFSRNSSQKTMLSPPLSLTVIKDFKRPDKPPRLSDPNNIFYKFDIEIFSDMKPNVARIFIWDNGKNTSEYGGGHIAMALYAQYEDENKNLREKMEYISLYSKDAFYDNSKGCIEYCMQCFTDEPMFSIGYTGFSPDSTVRAEGIFKFKDECRQGVQHANYIIDLQFSEDNMKNMIDCWDSYKEYGNLRYRLCGDCCCLDGCGICSCRISRYQNCNSLCYNILLKGNYRELFPTTCYKYDIWQLLGQVLWVVINFTFVYGVTLAALVFVDKVINGFLNLNITQLASIALIPPILLTFFVFGTNTFLFFMSRYFSGLAIWLSPMAFKRELINAATSTLIQGQERKIKMFHTEDSLKRLNVIVPEESKDSNTSHEPEESKDGLAAAGGGRV